MAFNRRVSISQIVLWSFFLQSLKFPLRNPIPWLKEILVCLGIETLDYGFLAQAQIFRFSKSGVVHLKSLHYEEDNDGSSMSLPWEIIKALPIPAVLFREETHRLNEQLSSQCGNQVPELSDRVPAPHLSSSVAGPNSQTQRPSMFSSMKRRRKFQPSVADGPV